jgi:hypothetical protein
MSDPYGIPPNMFGIVPEEFFGALGRVVMVAALLELQLLDLVTTLDQASQQTHAGKSGTELIKACRTVLDNREPSLRAVVVPVLDRADDELAMQMSFPRFDGQVGCGVRGRVQGPNRPVVDITLVGRGPCMGL